MKFAKTLDIPSDAVTQKIAYLGRTGSGKSYAALKVTEQMLDIRAQVIVLDPVGVHYALRLAPNGKSASRYKIYVFGGLHGDYPLESTAGAYMADLLVNRGISAVLDVSQMTTSEQTRFFLAFATRFFQRKKNSPSAVHLVLEECQEMVPQNPMRGGDEPKMLNAFERLIKLGRNFGVGVSLISQRPQEINKKALNQTELLLAFQMTGPQEKKAIKSWVAEKGLDEEDLDHVLPRLKVGQAHAWSPQWLEVSEVVHVNRRSTYDASDTPKVGARAAKVRPLGKIDLKKIEKDMAETVERAKAEDPRELQAEIRRLNGELAKKGTARAPAEVRTVVQVKKIPTPFLKPRQMKTLKAFVAAASNVPAAVKIIEMAMGKMERAGKVAPEHLEPEHHFMRGLVRNPEIRVSRNVKVFAAAPRPFEQARKVKPARPAGEEVKGLGKGARDVMKAIAQFADGVDDNQLAVLTGYKRSTRDAYILRLSKAGYVERASKRTTATQKGLAWLGSDYEPLPTGAALRAHWLAKLPVGEKIVLELALSRYPKPIMKDQLENLTGYKRSTYDAYILRLSKKRLVTTTIKEVFAAKELF